MKLVREKEQFVQRMNENIKMCKTLLNFYNKHVISIVKSFEGKVHNVRLENTLIDAFKSKNLNGYIKLERCYTPHHIQYSIQLYRDKYSYTDTEVLYISIKLDDNNNRIIGIGEDEERFLSILTTEIDNCKNSIKQFDSGNKKMEKIEKLIRELESVPYHVRHNIDYFDSIYLPKN